MAGIPENVIFEILLLLPVSSLSRFRCVSKQWRHLIDSSHFGKSHFNCSAIREEDRPLVIFYEKFYSYLVKLDSIRNDPPPPILIQHPYPRWKEVHDYYSVVGTCNGLICVRDIDHSALVISNPSTGKHLRFRLPEADGVSFECFGFGYDRVSDDYKVASVGRFGDWQYNHYGERIFRGRFMVQIYSVGCGRWRKLGDLPQSLVRDTNNKWKKGVFAGGALHWEVEADDGFLGRSSKRSIVRLDLGKLEYTVKALPEDCVRVISVAAVDGCLWLTCSSRYRGLDVWVMKKEFRYGYWIWYWSRLIRSAGLHISRFPKLLMPLGYVDDGKAVLFVTDSNQTVRIGTETGSFQEVAHYWSTPDLGNPVVYRPTLAFPQTAGNS